MYCQTTYESPIGALTIACDEGGKNLVGLWTDGQKYHGDIVHRHTTKACDTPLLGFTKKWLDRYFAGERPDVSELPLAPVGSDFRQRVWRILLEIPYGEVITYGDIAKEVAAEMGKKSMSSQAVGGAVGHNPISIIIPCHRVVGSNGSLTGYAGGLDIKVRLLELEGVDMSRFFMPVK
jgi:methylated-DNA-[protein]-cysteine S-methyltransferase